MTGVPGVANGSSLLKMLTKYDMVRVGCGFSGIFEESLDVFQVMVRSNKKSSMHTQPLIALHSLFTRAHQLNSVGRGQDLKSMSEAVLKG